MCIHAHADTDTRAARKPVFSLLDRVRAGSGQHSGDNPETVPLRKVAAKVDKFQWTPPPQTDQPIIHTHKNTEIEALPCGASKTTWQFSKINLGQHNIHLYRKGNFVLAVLLKTFTRLALLLLDGS